MIQFHQAAQDARDLSHERNAPYAWSIQEVFPYSNKCAILIP